VEIRQSPEALGVCTADVTQIDATRPPREQVKHQSRDICIRLSQEVEAR